MPTPGFAECVENLGYREYSVIGQNDEDESGEEGITKIYRERETDEDDDDDDS